MDARNKSSQSWLQNLFSRVKNVYVETARDVLGDIWDASSNDGLGLTGQFKLGEYKKVGVYAHENRDQKDIEKKMTEVTKIPTYFRFLHKQIPEFSHPSQVKALIFDNPDAIQNNDVSGIFNKLFGDHTIFEKEAKTEPWKKLSNEFHQHFFVDPRVKRILPDIFDIAMKYQKEAEKGITNLANFSARFAMETMGATQLGLVNFPDDYMNDFTATIDEVAKKIANPKNSTPWPLNTLVEFIDKYAFGQKTLEEAMAPGYAGLAGLIKLNQENILNTPNWIRDISLRKAWDPNNTKTQDEWDEALASRGEQFVALLYSPAVLKNAALSLVVGHETTAQTLQFALTFLADPKHKPVVDAMREEIQNYLIANNKELDALTKEDLDKLIFVKAVFYESLRLRPPLARMKGGVKRDVTVGDVTLRKGDIYFISTVNVHLNEEVYKDPLVFNPWRFLEKDSEGKFTFKEPAAHQFFPFGFQERKCPGRKFSRMEIMSLLGIMLMKNRYLIEDPHCYQTQQGFNLHTHLKLTVKALPLDEPKPAARPG